MIDQDQSHDLLVNRDGLVGHHGTPKDWSGGYYTFLGSRGASVIDYIWSSSAFNDEAYCFNVFNRTESDHLPIAISFHHTQLGPPSSPHPQDSLTLAPGRKKWDIYLEQDIKVLLNSPEILALKAQLLTMNVNHFSIFQQILAYLLPSLTKPSRAILTWKNQTWFDQECKQCRSRLRFLQSDMKSDSTQSKIRELAQFRSYYKKLLQHKKLLFAKERWTALSVAIKTRDDKKFWNLINAGLRPPSFIVNNITAASWHSHFAQLYSAPDSDVNVVTTLPASALPTWEPVSPERCTQLISMLSGDKSPGEDMIPPEVFLSNQSWWAPILASLFTTINATLKIPPNWKQSIVIPIHKKGDPQDPRNYRPISLLDISYKVYSRFLLEKLIEWAEETKLFHPEQAGFRKGHSTSGQCLVLLTLIDKYLNRFNCKLHAAFVDLTSAFDSIPRDRLWQKLSYTSIDKRLLLLLMEIHNDISARVKFGPLGALSDSFPLNKGVKQGCLLAPFLFNFYINDIVTTMKALNQSAPSLQQLKIPILLYPDDMVILSLTKLGLNNTLRGLMTYCDTNSLKINFAKTKILTFGTKTRKSPWNFEGHSIEYCSAFKYLGIIFQHGLSWSAHLNTTILAARRTIKALEKFYYAKGGQLVPPIRKAFISKVLPMLLYGVEIWGWNLKTLQRLTKGNGKGMVSAIYKILLQNLANPLDAIKNQWENDIGYEINPTQWTRMWSKPPFKSISTKRKELTLKLTYRWYLTPRKLALIHPGTSPKCWRGCTSTGTYFHMWWECPKIQLFWTTAIQEICKITKQVIDITPELALLNIFQDNNAHLHHKELITHLLSAARNTITRHWRDLSGVSMDQWYQIVWETALLEKLTNKLKLTRGQTEEDAFTPVWLPFITHTAQQDNDNNPPTAYKSIWLT
uniref:Reverse transcriptase domain-containing protein n=1 Tax=Podarcis muralis TaxID=64176 RepID=A0A670KKD3_PODMU